jgi:hypothetical protein
LKDKLMAPKLVAEFIRTFQEEVNAAAKTAAARSEQLKREAEAVERKIAGIMAAIKDGTYTPALKERMRTLEARKAEIQAILASTAAPPVVRLHPNAAEVYRRKVAELELALNDDSIKAEAGEILRSLIDRVVLTRRARRRAGAERRQSGQAETPGRGGGRESTVGGCGGAKPPTVDSSPSCS